MVGTICFAIAITILPINAALGLFPLNMGEWAIVLGATIASIALSTAIGGISKRISAN